MADHMLDSIRETPKATKAGQRTTSVVVITLIAGSIILIALIGALVLIPTQVLSLTISEQARAQQEQLARSLAHNLEVLFSQTANDLISLSERSEIQSTTRSTRPAARSRIAEVGQQYNGQLTEIVRIDDTGQPVYAWPDDVNQKIVDGKALDWAINQTQMQAIAQTSGVQFIIQQAQSGSIYLMVLPIQIGTNLTEGIAFRLAIEKYAASTLSSLTLSPSTQLWLFDQQGQTIYQQKPTPAWTAGTGDILQQRDVTLRDQFPTNNQASVIAPVFTAFTQERTAPTLTLVVSRNPQEGLTELYDIIKVLFLIGLGVVIFIGALALAVGRFVLRESHRNSTVTTLLENSRVINSSLDLPVVLDQILSQLSAMLPYDGASIMLLDDKAEEPAVSIAAKRGTLEIEGGQETFALKDVPIAAAVVQSAKPLVLNNTHRDTRWIVQNTGDSGVEAWLGVPLTQRDRVLGILCIGSSQLNRFDSEDVELANAFANQATVAIQNARVTTELQKAKDAAEQANQVKSTFLANMSHELRTPLNAILNFTAFISDGLMGPVNDEQAESLQKVINSARHLLNLINDVLDITKIEVGMMELFIEDVDLKINLKSVLSVTKGLTKDKPIQLITEIDNNLPIIQGDRRRIQQVFLNLISNAVKFTQQGSITVRAYAQNEEVHVSVTDTGIGIAPDKQHLVFESFRQINSGLSETPGTGLGMPISKHFVEAHGGQLWFESEVGVGTTFHVVLPIHTSEAALVQVA